MSYSTCFPICCYCLGLSKFCLLERAESCNCSLLPTSSAAELGELPVGAAVLIGAAGASLSCKKHCFRTDAMPPKS